jgi:hypothetical protein
MTETVFDADKTLAGGQTIRADLFGDTLAQGCGCVACSSSPVIELCRRLVAAGHDPSTPLEAYRGDTLCLHVRSIGEAAELRVNGHGVGFRKPMPVDLPEGVYSDLDAEVTP